MIATNHTGDDIPLFASPCRNRAEYFRRQIEGSVNFNSGTDIIDFLHGGLNYQIEHHLWPKGTLLQYRKIQPRLKELCKRHGIAYRVEPVHKRVAKTFAIISGAQKPLVVDGV